MANTIKVKRSSVAGKVPTTGDLELGEIAINTYDGKMYFEKNDGTASVVQVGDVVGAASATDNALVRFDGTTGKLIQNSTNATLDDSGNLDVASAKVDYLQLDTAATPAGAVGRFIWDDGEGTATLGLKGGNVSLQLGQEQLALCYNGSGSTIANGAVVAVTGAQGSKPSIVLADADSEALSASTLGVATESIANGAEGFVNTFGLVRNVDTSAFTAGAPLYLSQTAGGLTMTRPSAPAHTVFIGWAIKINASSGEIFLNINNGWELDELHNVLITSPASGNTLIYDASVGVWKNANLTDGTGITITEGAGSITITNSGVTSAVAGTGISVSGATGAVTITNTGVTSITGTANQITASASTGGVTLSLPATINVNTSGNAATATTATNLAGGAANRIPYQTGAGATSFVAAPTVSNQVLTYDGSNLTWAVGAGSGTVTSVSGTGTVSGITLSGTVTTSGNLTLGGSLDLSSPPAIGGTTPNTVTGSAIIGISGSGNQFEAKKSSGGGALALGSYTTFFALVEAINGGGLSLYTGNGTLTRKLAITANGGFSFDTTATGYGSSGQILQSNGDAPPSWVAKPTGTVTSVSGTGTVAGITLTGTVTSSGNLTLGGTFALPSGQVPGKIVYDSFTATASQTTFTTSATYTSGKIDVYCNGVRMVNGADVTVTSGTQVVFATGLASGSRVDVNYPI